MSRSGGKVTVDADRYLELLDELSALEGRLRALGSEGFNVSKTTQPSSPASKKKAEEKAMDLDIDVSGIEWKKSNRDGGGPAGPDAGWAWAFGYTQDGGILPGAVQLIQAMERYGTVKIGGFEYSLGGRDKRLLNRKRAK